ncbi:B3 domain-containing transcription repressor VAL1-like isoform X2 [Durio zibethinus]|uniref:B3 domain-containing transcription repressor VAL1-like isoform X2 n=1 Tax=Durio zibethinus TaxID=66656 RepID=A0A6P5XVV3_DURZI|nr:B3 domain-containing transcription repressor VAL1-like isoform X2 [Durio zibethinus]
MGSKICMNSSCGTATTREWKKGWPLRSGGFAHLCYRCGSAYEDNVYCDTFHVEESGWRECRLCSKRLHCGCIASKYLLELLDYGGVGCTSCAKSSRFHSVRRIQTHGDEIPKGFSGLPMNNAGSIAVEGKAVGDHVDERTLAQLCKIMEVTECNLLPQSQRGDANASLGQRRGEEVTCPIGEVGAGFSNAMQPYVQPPSFAKTNNARPALDIRDLHDSLSQPSLNMTLGGLSGNPNFALPFPSGLADGKEQGKMASSFQQGQRSRPILPKPSKNGLATSSEVNKSVVPQARIARPPVEGRGKNHLLPRYWPRITDQELQKLSGDLKSTIVPLFEKVLSASDAGRIGRLVLPKACAEAYFPPISQSEGLPLKIQDVNGKEWTFQFRFWPNNNSRMYVLEGVTPCIQSMQLRAGDTVTFSRKDPGEKLVIGFRRATNTDTQQEGQTSSLPNGAHSGETSHSGGIENLSTVSAYSGLLQTPKGGKGPLLNALSEHLGLPDGNISWGRGDNHGDGANEDPMQQPAVNAEKRRTRNIGSKSKRLLMHNEDALELRLTWEEAQDLLRPPPSVRPSIVTIEDHEFEEYDEPPVFGKRTIFAARPSGGQEQWAQCDDCSKWRRLPIDVLLPPKWTCSDNVWDSSRCSCSAPEEISQKELENLLKVGRDLKKQKLPESPKLAPDSEPSGLDALASAAVLGDKLGDVGESSVGATTKHPRHRPGCTCIVCIQPPSGKGKHKPTCTCNVCLTVKRRFKTLMLRRKKRQSEREAEISQKDNNEHKDEPELNDTRHGHSENEGSQSRIQAEVAETSTGQIDLNCHPNREELQLEVPGLNMTSLVQTTGMPVENYIKQNGIASLMSEQQGSLTSHLLSQANRENDRHLSDEEFLASVGWKRDNRSDEGHKESSMERNGLQ